MKHALKAILIAGAVGVGTMLTAPAANARHRESSTSVYVDLGGVSVAYRNGYYDDHRRWHRWRGDDERRHFRRHYGSRYRDHDYHDGRYDRDRGRHRGHHRRRHDWDD